MLKDSPTVGESSGSTSEGMKASASSSASPVAARTPSSRSRDTGSLACTRAAAEDLRQRATGAEQRHEIARFGPYSGGALLPSHSRDKVLDSAAVSGLAARPPPRVGDAGTSSKTTRPWVRPGRARGGAGSGTPADRRNRPARFEPAHAQSMSVLRGNGFEKDLLQRDGDDVHRHRVERARFLHDRVGAFARQHREDAPLAPHPAPGARNVASGASRSNTSWTRR